MKNNIKKIISSIFIISVPFFFANNIMAYEDLNSLYNTDPFLMWKKITVSLYVQLVSYEQYDKWHKVRIEWYNNDGFWKKDVYNNTVSFDKKGKAKIDIEIDPSNFDISKKLMFKIYVDDLFLGQIKKNVVQIWSYISDNTKYLVDAEEWWKKYTIDDFIDVKEAQTEENKINKKIDEYKKNLLGYTDIKNYVILENWKLNSNLLPFSMNNLACDLKEPDLVYVEDKLNIKIDRQSVILDYPCRDWMLDLHALITIIKAYNWNSDLLKEYTK